jgi:hypothetical protein
MRSAMRRQLWSFIQPVLAPGGAVSARGPLATRSEREQRVRRNAQAREQALTVEPEPQQVVELFTRTQPAERRASGRVMQCDRTRVRDVG